MRSLSKTPQRRERGSRLAPMLSSDGGQIFFFFFFQTWEGYKSRETRRQKHSRPKDEGRFRNGKQTKTNPDPRKSNENGPRRNANSGAPQKARKPPKLKQKPWQEKDLGKDRGTDPADTHTQQNPAKHKKPNPASNETQHPAEEASPRKQTNATSTDRDLSSRTRKQTQQASNQNQQARKPASRALQAAKPRRPRLGSYY